MGWISGKNIATSKTFTFWGLSFLATTGFALAGIGYFTGTLHGPRTEKRIALTFDDGPNPPYTEKFLELLRREKIRATFFFIGRNIEMHPLTAKRVAEAGHEIGNHSYSHPWMAFLWPWQIGREIQATDSLIQALGISSPILFRAPFGERWGTHSLWLAWNRRTNLLYDVAPIPADYHRADPLAISKSAIERAKPGSILLLHDGEGIRVEALEAANLIIAELKARGFSFATVSELLQTAHPPSSDK